MAHSICRTRSVVHRATNNHEKGKEKEATELPKHLEFRTGACARQLLSLHDGDIVDSKGDVTEKYATTSVPSLTRKEMESIQNDLFTPFPWELGEGKVFSLSFANLALMLLEPSVQHEFRFTLQTLSIIGEFVRDFLFSKTNYMERVFHELKAGEIYEKGCLLPPRAKPILNVRTCILYPSGAHNFRINVVAKILARMYLAQTEDPIGEERAWQLAIGQLEKYPYPVETSENSFVLFPFEGSPVHWMAYFNQKLKRTHVFTSNALSIPVYPLLYKLEWNTRVYPECFENHLIECLLHGWLRLIKAKEIHTLDEKGWFWLINDLIQGYDSAQHNLGRYLLAKAPFYKLDIETDKWVKKNHYSGEGLFCLIFLMGLQGRANKRGEEFEKMQTTHLASLKRQTLPPATQEMATLWLDHQIPHEILGSFLQIVGLLAILQEQEVTSFEMGTCGFEKPVVKCLFNKAVLPLELDLEKALDTLLDFQKQNLNQWEKLERSFISLLFLLYSPSNPFSSQREKICRALSLETLPKKQDSFIHSSSPLLNYLWLSLAFSLPATRDKKKLAEQHFHEVLPLARENRRVKEQFESIIGEVGVIPDCHSDHFLQEWVRCLFQNGRQSEETALAIWKSMEHNETTLPFSLTLLLNLALTQPLYANSLLTHLKNEGLLQKESVASVDLVVRCSEKLKKIKATEEHEAFIDQMGRILPQLIEDPLFTPTLGKKRFTKAFLWFYNHLNERRLEKDASALQHVCTSKGLIEEKPTSAKQEESEQPVEVVETPVEKHDNTLSTLNSLMEMPQLNHKEVKLALSLYYKGLNQNLFSIEQEVSILLFLIPKATLNEIYHIPTAKQNRGRGVPVQPQAKGILLSLLTHLENNKIQQLLNSDTKKKALLVLIPILMKVTLHKRDKQRVNQLLSLFFPFLDQENEKRELIALCAASRGYFLAYSENVHNFWINALKLWHQEDKGENADLIARYYAVGASQGFNDPDFSRVLEEERKKKVVAGRANYFEFFTKKTHFSSEEIQKCKGIYQSCLDTHTFSNEQELFILTTLLLHDGGDSWVYTTFLDRVKPKLVRKESYLKILQALMRHEREKKLSIEQKATLSLIFNVFSVALIDEEDKKTFLLICTNRNISLLKVGGREALWNQTLIRWLTDSPQDIKKIERCCRHLVKSGFENKELHYRLPLIYAQEACKRKSPLQVEWVELCIEGFPQYTILWKDLFDILSFAMTQNNLGHRRKLWIKLIAEKDITLPTLLLQVLVEEALKSERQKDVEDLLTWLCATEAFSRPDLPTEFQETLESLILAIWGPKKSVAIKTELIVGLGIKYFNHLGRIPPQFWIECVQMMDEIPQKGAYGLFSLLLLSKRIDQPLDLQWLYFYTFRALFKSSDPLILNFLDQMDTCHNDLERSENPETSFFSYIYLALGCCQQLRHHFMQKGFDTEETQNEHRLNQLLAIRDKVLDVVKNVSEEQRRECQSEIGGLDLALVNLFFSTRQQKYIAQGRLYLKILLLLPQPVDSFALEGWQVLEGMCELKEMAYFEELDLLLEKLLDCEICPNQIHYDEICQLLLQNRSPERVYYAIRTWRLYLLTEAKKKPEKPDCQPWWALLDEILTPIVETKEKKSIEEALVSLRSFRSYFKTLPAAEYEDYLKRVLVDFSPFMDSSYSTLLQVAILDANRRFLKIEYKRSETILSALRVGLISLCHLNYDNFVPPGNEYWLFIRDLEGDHASTFLKELMESIKDSPAIKMQIKPFLSICMEYLSNQKKEL